MAGRLVGKVALITGATSGIGEATAELFAAEGAHVLVVGRSEMRGRAIADRIGSGAIFIAADVSREEDIKRIIDTAVERFGRLDILFNNAGADASAGVETVTQETFREAMDLLVGSVLMGIRYAAPVMRAQGRGAIINNSSVAAVRVALGHYLYSVAKAAVTHATKYAGVVLGKDGITVNCISPGAIATPIFMGGADHVASMVPDKHRHVANKVDHMLAGQNPLLRAGLSREVAYAALFLGSDEGAFVNGHDLVVDGGMTASGKIDYRTE